MKSAKTVKVGADGVALRFRAVGSSSSRLVTLTYHGITSTITDSEADAIAELLKREARNARPEIVL